MVRLIINAIGLYNEYINLARDGVLEKKKRAAA